MPPEHKWGIRTTEQEQQKPPWPDPAIEEFVRNDLLLVMSSLVVGCHRLLGNEDDDEKHVGASESLSTTKLTRSYGRAVTRLRHLWLLDHDKTLKRSITKQYQ